MSFAALLPQEAIRQTYTSGSQDDYGNATESWVSGSTYPARLEQTSQQEVQVGQNTEIADWLAFLPADATLTGRDRLVVDGQTFTLVGPPQVVYDAHFPHHKEVRLRSIS